MQEHFIEMKVDFFAFWLQIEGQGHGAVFDGKVFSEEDFFTATDSHLSSQSLPSLDKIQSRLQCKE